MTPVQRSDLLTVAVLAAAVALSAAVVWLFVASGAGMPLSIALGLGARLPESAMIAIVTGDLSGQCVLWGMLIFSLALVVTAGKAMEGSDG